MKSVKVVVLAAFLMCFVYSEAFAASLKGKTAFEGTVPPLAALKMDSDPQCAANHPNGASSEDILASNGMLQNVFVYVKEGASATAAPAEPVVLDQKGCRYSPHVLGVQVGQDIQIVNSDSTLHNVHAMPNNSKQFNLGMPLQGMKLKKKFDKAEVMVRVKCDVHPWMNAYIGVLEHPYYAVTAEDGSFEIKNLPEGTYTVEAWHEKLGTQTQTVTVGAEDAEANFVFKG